MSDPIAATFTDVEAAEAAMDALRRLKKGNLTAIDDAAVVRKDDDGKTRVKNSLDQATIGGRPWERSLGRSSWSSSR